ncbi:MAG: flagellar motor protein [Deltaproteobacteria bacterium]|nr:flagellar motor protein [Deltaproteobacteria bacterium]
MQPGPLLGIAFALLAILGGNALEGGHLNAIVGGPAALIVLGGTIGAVIVQYPLSTLKAALSAAGKTFKKPTQEASGLVEEIVGYANQARRDGILALEKVAASASDPFLGKALMMAIDGADSNALRETMELSIGQHEEHGEDAAKVFEAAGGYCPTVGIIGAVLGLIHVMSNLSDIAKVGSGIAAAFVATIYGVAAANILFLPLAGRIKLQVRDEVNLRQLALVGVLAIQEGMNPKLVRERLGAFVHDPGGAKAGGAGEPARAH